MGRRTILLIASILVAAVGTGLIALYVRGADSRAREGTAQVRVFFAVKKIPAGARVGTLLNGDSIKERTAAADSVPQDALSLASLGALDKKVAQVEIVPGAPLQAQMFGDSATVASSAGITAGNVAGSFELTDPQRVANLLQPGMRVSVYFVPPDGDATVAIPSVKVLQIGTQVADSQQDDGATTSDSTSPNADQVPRTILTFDLTEKQELALLQNKRDGELALGLLGPTKSPEPTP